MGPRPVGHAPPAKRRRLLLPGKAIGFSPFFRSLSRRFLRPIPAPLPRVATASRGEAPTRAALPSKRSMSAHHRTEPSMGVSSSDDDGDLDEDDEEEEQDDMVEETVQVDFEFFDPKPEDFHGVKLLLRNYLGDRQWDLSGFVDLIMEQTTVWTVVKLNRTEEDDNDEEEDDVDGPAGGGAAVDDEGPYAVMSVLNLGRYASHQCFKELKEYLIEVCPENAVKNKLRPMLEGQQAHNIGLLVHERFVNFPHQPVPHLYDALFDEVSWATEDEETQEVRDSFRFKSYLLLTRIFVRRDADIGTGRSKVPLGKKNKSSNGFKGRIYDRDESIVYTKAEDEIFHKLCSLSFTFDFPRKEQFVPPEARGGYLPTPPSTMCCLHAMGFPMVCRPAGCLIHQSVLISQEKGNRVCSPRREAAKATHLSLKCLGDGPSI